MSDVPLRTAEIVTIGDELLLGVIGDTNAQYLSAAVAAFGVRVVRHTTVGDDLREIREALRDAVGRSPLVIVTGGLGVTPDDCTRPALAELAGARLVPDPELLQEMEVLYRDRKIRMPSVNIAQAALPEGARKIPNRVGLAPGIHLRVRKAEVFAFPGVPAEMRHLTETGLLPYLRERNGEAAVPQRVLRTWGIGENALAEHLADYLSSERPVSVAFLPERRGVTLRFRLKEGDHENPQRVLDENVDEAANLLGNLIYSTREEELEEVVGYLLMLHRRTVAVAESCTGGRVADLLTTVPGSSAFFREGFVPYQASRKIETLGVPEDLIRRAGTVSAEVAAELARRARARAGTDIGIGVTGVAGPESVEGKPVGLVYAALDADDGTIAREWRIPGSRDRVKDRAALHAINLVRLYLLGGPGEAR
ncbi:MAG: competence/damage-inducible protein A [Candidatus Eisenbacteria bacterium]|nr:competence/damage-inducible protein A [Candidatus Eisenbacteria bacterium]